MTRALRGIGAVVVVAVLSSAAATLSVGHQPAPATWIDQSRFTIIRPAGGGSVETAARGTAVAIGDFKTAASGSGLPRRVPVVHVSAQVVMLHPISRSVHVANGGPRPAVAPPPPPPPPPSSGHVVSGRASWFCLPGTSACTNGYNGGMYAAAGAEIRIGNWRGRTVKVCGNGNCVRVRLIDWCGCPGARIIDLYNDAFRQLANPSAGTIAVTISW